MSRLRLQLDGGRGRRMYVAYLVVGLCIALGSSANYAQERGGAGDKDGGGTTPLVGPAGVPVVGPDGKVDPATLENINPINVTQGAAEAVGIEGGVSGVINILILMTILSLAPSLLVMCTSFVRIIIVLGLLRRAIGTQQLPPGQVVTGLALFMTFMIMAPTFGRVHSEALVPLSNGTINSIEAWEAAKAPLREFMVAQIDRTDNWGDVHMVMEYRGIDMTKTDDMTIGDVDMVTLIPSFILSELKTAFVIGFRIYLPFLIIDMVIASVLISMGMMMLPPVLISLPFKLLLFVLVDGWRLVVGNLLQSFDQNVVAEGVRVVFGSGVLV